MKRTLFLFLFILLSGCASFGRGIVEGFLSEDHTDNATECLIWSSGFNGLKPTHEKVTKVLLVHGIGLHSPGHSTPLMLALTQRMGFSTQNRNYKEIEMKNAQNEPVGVLRIYRFSNPETNQAIIFYEQTWASITFPSKEKLAYDVNQEYSAKRTKVNAVLKKYADETLPDPLIYLGPDGTRMLDSSIQSFCWMTSYTYEDLPQRSAATCQISSKDAIYSLKNDRFAFITSSLGSRIAIDALQTIALDINHLPPTKENKEALSLLRDKDIPIFMFANQLPLLQMGRTKPLNAGKIKEFCDPNGVSYNKRLFKQLDVIAFSDPNDLLSYALEPDAVDLYFDSALCPVITNVSLTITPRINLGFGEVANPLSAHQNYEFNPLVLNMIVDGLKTGYTSPDVEKECRWIHLKGK